MLKHWTSFLQIELVYAGHKDHTVGISHRYAGSAVIFPRHRQRLRNKTLPLRSYGYFRRPQHRPSHVDLDIRHLFVFHRQRQLPDTALRLYGNAGLSHDAVLIGILRHTADPIAAHCALRSVGIVHDHAAVCRPRGRDQNQSVGPDPEMPVADTHCQRRRVLHLLFKRIDIDIIISRSMHFRKMYSHHNLLIVPP